MSLQIILWELLCIALLYSVFCRLVHTSKKSTKFDVRLTIYSLGLAAIVGIGAPLYGWRPDFVVFVMTATCLAMQIVAARHWRQGVPNPFQISERSPS